VAESIEVISRLPPVPTGRPPLLFVHGAGHAAWSWDEHWLAACAARGYAAHALSLRGHGASPAPRGLQWCTLADYEHDVRAVARGLGEPCVLVGHSMGGTVVQRCLGTLPVRAAVLVASAGTHGVGEVVPSLFATLPVRGPMDLLRLATPGGVPFDVARRWLFSDALPDDLASRYLGRMSFESVAAMAELFVPWAVARPANTPVLVLAGADDPLTPPALAERAAAFYGTRATVIAGVSHEMMLDARWEAALGAMLDWLDGSVR